MVSVATMELTTLVAVVVVVRVTGNLIEVAMVVQA
jgi:hypothetical protein